MKHIFYIDPIEKLNVKKDSSLFWALTLKDSGENVYLLFDEDLSLSNKGEVCLKLYEFNGEINQDYYIDAFEVLDSSKHKISHDKIYFRVDPPIDTNYLRSAWLIHALCELSSSEMTNSSLGTVRFNEKILGLKEKNSLPSLITNSFKDAREFIKSLDQDEFILKPLNGFSGIGVEKHLSKSIDELENLFGADKLILQPFDKRVREGEVRSIYWKAKELGHILKVPESGSYLSNIAQGAKFHQVDLPENLNEQCEKICSDLLQDGIELVAFDILGGNISEVNITCPGLLVEVSSAYGKNLAKQLI